MALSAALCHCYTSGRCRHQYELVVSNMHMPLHALYSFGHWALLPASYDGCPNANQLLYTPMQLRARGSCSTRFLASYLAP